jgi:predicted DNA-binding protein (MmcQ/YjbR family)
MINDLPAQMEKTKNVKSALYADDVAIWISLPQCQEHQLSQIINDALTTHSNWCNENAMTINIEKTMYEIFTLSHKQPTINLKINNNAVVQTQNAIYLGVYLDGKLIWKNHIKKTTE